VILYNLNNPFPDLSSSYYRFNCIFWANACLKEVFWTCAIAFPNMLLRDNNLTHTYFLVYPYGALAFYAWQKVTSKYREINIVKCYLLRYWFPIPDHGHTNEAFPHRHTKSDGLFDLLINFLVSLHLDAKLLHLKSLMCFYLHGGDDADDDSLTISLIIYRMKPADCPPDGT